ncbi:MAG: DnaJ domain-containing protein, partial [Gammaproteobacteria bacterium]|nr:DnaJ domain-containing protein [Gammaproteobacteria bacterium]
MKIYYKAQCSCGYEKELNLSGGQFCSPKAIPTFPCYCQNCKSLFELKACNKKLTWSKKIDSLFRSSTMCCANCGSRNFIPYDTLTKPSGLDPDNYAIFLIKTESYLGRDLSLYDTNYYCPECNQYKLKFKRKFLYEESKKHFEDNFKSTTNELNIPAFLRKNKEEKDNTIKTDDEILNTPTVFRKYNDPYYVSSKRISGPVNSIVKILPNHYKFLQIKEDASEQDINDAYNNLFEKFKLDSDELLKSLLKAYDVLSDPEQRKDYDNLLQKERGKRLIDEIPHRAVCYLEKNKTLQFDSGQTLNR